MSSTLQAPPRTGTARPEKPPVRWQTWAAVIIFVGLTWWAGSSRFGLGFSLSPLFGESLTRGTSIIAEFFEFNWPFLWRVRTPWLETVYIAVIASLIGCALALPFSLLASKVTAPNRAAYQFCKTLLSVIRSLPDVAYGLLMVAFVGTGALGGILALIFFNIGIAAKLTSETVDAIDLGPIEAAQASGANRIQTSWVSVVPQILPNYLAYSLYVFELNIRASVVIGLVGGGGIGNVIRVQLQQFNFGNVGTIIVALFVLVFVLDRVSISLRRRLV